ncbi:ptpla domain protein [Culex quinquefasciatus]|uniref:Very-long-chain (3R)-3-hydroxyacyl-CoA dehydratase n=1 Tax=Culex quinquefasciatus TaxID=7176 RepID=B0WVP9_CULQU|nr:very-long-chain (3R)-3-hydroxyacyl-CoA dehydratase hpo-8 [Culex quinquefasciatus]EDS35656.1 ptpla domain protein [Culex quinquefasciatus]|eukprot:XP_001861471.1 ptpla domain protein [Culex quinquefasciatus]
MPDRKKEQSAVVKLYLILYNLAQFLGWFYIFVQFVLHFFVEGKPREALWARVGSAVYFFQVISFLEFFHALFRLVPSNALITLAQVFGRSMVVVAAIDATPTGKLSPGVPLCVFCWSLAETIRYSYYLMHLALARVPRFMTWLRYTMFIPLYPGGFIGELLSVYWAQDYIGSTDMWSVAMPNRYNFTFSFYYFTWIMALGYLPLFPQMYLHMFGQRRKALGGGAERHAKVK